MLLMLLLVRWLRMRMELISEEGPNTSQQFAIFETRFRVVKVDRLVVERQKQQQDWERKTRERRKRGKMDSTARMTRTMIAREGKRREIEKRRKRKSMIMAASTIGKRLDPHQILLLLDFRHIFRSVPHKSQCFW